MSQHIEQVKTFVISYMLTNFSVIWTSGKNVPYTIYSSLLCKNKCWTQTHLY